MHSRKLIARAIPGLIVLFAAVGAYHAAYRPWALTWGANREEVRRAMPGDEIVREPTFHATRAVSIAAPPEEVWPWIVQMGYRKAGFYSYDALDHDGVPSAEQILPQYQALKTGDLVPMSKGSNAAVTALIPNRLLVLVFQSHIPATWVWSLESEPGNRTRLVTRLRVHILSAPRTALVEAGEIWMMRKCMLGIKRRAESLSARR